jgi:hypothetical protein
MKFNQQWQLALCAILLMTVNACKDRNASEHAMTAASGISAKVHMQESPGINGVVADSTFKMDNNQVPNREQDPKYKQGASPQQPVTPNPDWEKKIIKNATLSVEVKDYAGFNAMVRAAVAQAGGYIAQEEQSESDYKIENNVTIKVPVDQFDHAVQALTPGKEKVLVRKITSQDVTGEVVDTKSRLEAKRQVRLRYLDLLKQAKNMEEILQVQNEINEIQEHMESAAGRINYLTHSAAFSTIQLSYFQVLNAQAKDVETPRGFGQKVLAALTGGLEWVGELIILLISLWPVWMSLLAGWWLYRKYRPAKRLAATKPVPAVEQES